MGTHLIAIAGRTMQTSAKSRCLQEASDSSWDYVMITRRVPLCLRGVIVKKLADAGSYVGSLRGQRGVEGTSCISFHCKHTCRFTAPRHLSPSHPCSPPAESNPTQSRFLSSSRLRLLCKKKEKKSMKYFFPPKWRGTMDAEVFLIREFTQKGSPLCFFSPFCSVACRKRAQAEREE